MDQLLRRAELDRQQGPEVVFEPPPISPWSSTEDEPELHRALQHRAPQHRAPQNQALRSRSPEALDPLNRGPAHPVVFSAMDDDYDDDGYTDLDSYDPRRVGFDDYDDEDEDGDERDELDEDLDSDYEDDDYAGDDEDYGGNDGGGYDDYGDDGDEDDEDDDEDNEDNEDDFEASDRDRSLTMIDPLLQPASPSSIDAPALMRGKRGIPRDSEHNVLPFRRRTQQRRIRRLRRHPLVRWMAPLATAIVILAVPISAAAWFLASPSFAMSEVTVIGDGYERVDREWVRGTLSGFDGTNIWLLPLDRAEAVLFRHPWIADVALRKQPPHTLEVRVVEREEAALYRDADQGLIYVDQAGRRIAPWSPSKGSPSEGSPSEGSPSKSFDDLPILSGKGEESHLASALGLVAEIQAAGPAWADGLSEIEILSELDYRLYTRDLPFPLLLRSGTVDRKARHLQALLPRILDRFETVGAVDLRFARRIIIEPVDSGSRRS